MNTPLYKQYENASPVGAYTMCNTFALVILDIDNGGEMAVAGFTNPCGAPGYDKIRRHKIHTTTGGRAYIRKGNMRFYFDKIMRMNGGY
jgi:hypothetical protein